jgi:CxxC-x17-CxxC domain-containing protein
VRAKGELVMIKVIKLKISWQIDNTSFELVEELDCTAFEAVEYSQQIALAVKAVQSDATVTINNVAKSTIDKYAAICDNCGKEDYVSFQPKLGKPFLCNVCYNKKRKV